MQRLRSANPRGVNFVVTVLVSFHPDGFITKNDRAFHVKCFYMEPDTIVTQAIQVSSLPTTELMDSMTMPKCEYSVRRDSPNGPTLTFANVGDTVYHVWECNPPEMGMLVKKCFVTDGDGENHPVVDYDGCSTDSLLLNELIYDQNLMRAHATSQVFKYADSNQLYFTCQIQLCQRQMGMCQDVTPPQCGVNRSNRSRRAVMKSTYPEIDVTTGEMLILDDDERRQVISSPLCVPKFTLPLIPLVLITVSVVSVSITLVVVNRNKEKNFYST
ncbi:zona pellucida-like domain protein [Dictyocaulus viviparus]|uniref:Zona pellucida-like domain protein n=1 Tax=Dictyocaulus viviparus TaxID=29172 RepID=A0A0D8Y4U4_DICVI|nr:zona pellucida-like domain protein [Dictyocaulus viviparus]